VQVQFVTPGTSNNALWTGPSGSPLYVSASSSFSLTGATSGTVTTNTYFNSTTSASTTRPGSSPTVSASSSVLPGSASGYQYVSTPNPAGTYTLGQTVVQSGLTVGASANYGGNSMVATPEPSGLLIAGIGGLGLIGYGLRRRKAVGA
jgi:hypothetical protein